MGEKRAGQSQVKTTIVAGKSCLRRINRRGFVVARSMHIKVIKAEPIACNCECFSAPVDGWPIYIQAEIPDSWVKIEKTSHLAAAASEVNDVQRVNFWRKEKRKLRPCLSYRQELSQIGDA